MHSIRKAKEDPLHCEQCSLETNLQLGQCAKPQGTLKEIFFLSSTNCVFVFFNVYLFLREGQRQRDSRERGTHNTKQAPGSELSAQSSTRGSSPQTTRSWPEPKLDAQQTEPSRRPMVIVLMFIRPSAINFSMCFPLILTDRRKTTLEGQAGWPW